MTTDAALAPLDRYKQFLDAHLTKLVAGRPLPAVRDAPPARVAVDRGAAWAWLVADPASAAPLGLLAPLLDDEFDPREAEVVDRAGHARPALLGLLCYAALQAVAASDRMLVGEQAESAARSVDALAASADRTAAALPDAVGAADGAKLAAIAWAALAAHRGGELLHDDRTAAAARRAFRAIVARQSPAGPYLVATARDNPETLWFHELQVAHAVASYGLQSGDPDAIASARRAAAWHLNETQPDHATNQPWGLTAFLA
ncbi:MAG TPA: hypothetical protein VF796_19465, partial [Humisphaera sp.]